MFTIDFTFNTFVGFDDFFIQIMPEPWLEGVVAF